MADNEKKCGKKSEVKEIKEEELENVTGGMEIETPENYSEKRE